MSEMDQCCPELEVRGAWLVAGTTRTSEHWSISRGREQGEQKEHYISRLRSLGSMLEAVPSQESVKNCWTVQGLFVCSIRTCAGDQTPQEVQGCRDGLERG